MTSLDNTKEFIYELGGKYYIIGCCECRECDDQKLIDLFQKYVILTEETEFKEYVVSEMQKIHRDKIADAYKELLHLCYVSIEKSEMTEDKVQLREKLVKEYEYEVDFQYARWIKADRCLFRKEVDEKRKVK